MKGIEIEGDLLFQDRKVKVVFGELDKFLKVRLTDASNRVDICRRTAVIIDHQQMSVGRSLD